MDNELEYECDGGEWDLHFCKTCRDVSEGIFCPSCDEGRCIVCGQLVKKGQPFTKEPDFGGTICGDPGCNEIAASPTVADLAARLGNGGAS